MVERVDLSRLQALCAAGAVILTEHSTHRMRERGIKTGDVLCCIRSGKIIEQYPEDRPAPSCLVMGKVLNGKPLHVVCGVKADMVCIITAYWPNTSKWESDFKTRKAVQQ